MASGRISAKSLTAAFVLFAVGGLAGAAAMAAWSSNASRLYLQMIRLSFASDQEMLLRNAWQKGDLRAALAHAACQVEADRGSRAFDPMSSAWHFWFPVFGIGLAEHAQWNPAEGTNVEAVARAQLAAVWERLGHNEEARSEDAEVMRITGLSDASQVREAAVRLLNEVPPTQPRR